MALDPVIDAIQSLRRLTNLLVFDSFLFPNRVTSSETERNTSVNDNKLHRTKDEDFFFFFFCPGDIDHCTVTHDNH